MYHTIATRVAVTVAMLAVIRCGLYVALPGVDLAAIPAAMPAREGVCSWHMKKARCIDSSSVNCWLWPVPCLM
jgi:hypothetical protein